MKLQKMILGEILKIPNPCSINYFWVSYRAKRILGGNLYDETFKRNIEIARTTVRARDRAIGIRLDKLIDVEVKL